AARRTAQRCRAHRRGRPALELSAAGAGPTTPSQRKARNDQVDLFEYQARDLFAEHGVPVLDGLVADTPEAARAAAEQIARTGGSPTVVVKAQVKVGGRGKAGGVKLAHSPDEAAAAAQQILGMDIKGHTVHRVMIAAGAKIAE